MSVSNGAEIGKYPSTIERNHLLDVKDCVVGVASSLLLGSITDQTLLLGEGDVRRGNSVTLVVDENFDFALLHHTDTRVGSTKILQRIRSANWPTGGRWAGAREREGLDSRYR